jgi:hypothetical protein
VRFTAVYSHREGNLSIRRVADGAETSRLPGPGVRHEWVDLEFSPDGRWLHANYRISGRPPQVAIREFREGTLGRRIILEHPGRFSRDSCFVAAARPDGGVGVYDVASSRERKQLG